jgi:acyl carrier protein
VLGLDQAGIHDDFFILGGHSLMATQVISRINEAFNITLPLRALFDLPTVSELAGAVEAEMSLGPAVQRPPIEPAPRDGQLPLSFAQQRMWVFDQLVPGSDVYNVPFAVRLSGSLDVDAFERTFNEVIRRHESLRTTFATEGGRPVQIVAERLEMGIPLVDLSGLLQPEQTAEARRIAARHNHRPFDLIKGPLIRVCIVRLSELEHVALVNMHHIISDGWSIGVLHREIVILYEAFAAGLPSPLKDPVIQYPDYAVWERLWLQGEVLEAQLSYWKARLSGAPPVLDLPTDRPRPATQTFNGASISRHLPRPSLDALREVSRRNGVTLFMTLLAAFDALLHYHTGRTDIIVGVDIANRGRVEVEDLIGFFANQLALRVDLSGDPAFTDIQKRARETALGAYANQDVSFDKLIEVLKPVRIPGRSPLFQVKLVHQNSRKSELSISSLKTARFESDVDVAKFDLLLNVIEGEEGLINTLFYNKDLFDKGRVERMLAQYDTILLAAVAQPESRLSALMEILADAERQQQMTEREEFKDARRRMLKDLKSRAVKAPRAKGEVGL